MEFSVIKELVGGEANSDLFIYKLRKDGISQICPYNGNYCTSRCPFFIYDDSPMVYIKLSCRSRDIKLYLSEEKK